MRRRFEEVIQRSTLKPVSEVLPKPTRCVYAGGVERPYSVEHKRMLQDRPRPGQKRRRLGAGRILGSEDISEGRR